MATKEQCSGYDSCGYIKWRKERPYCGMTPLPPDGDCGKEPEQCGRMDSTVPISVEEYGPRIDREMKDTFPEVVGDSGRPRRLVGGANK